MSVFAVHNLKFEVNTGTIASPVLTEIADIETLEDSIDSTVQEWTPLITEGWIRRLATGKSLTLTLTGKRNIGDTGNDYIAGIGLDDSDGQNEQQVTITFPLQAGDATPANLLINCVIDVTKAFGGGSTDVGGLDFAAMSDGKPLFTAAVPV